MVSRQFSRVFSRLSNFSPLRSRIAASSVLFRQPAQLISSRFFAESSKKKTKKSAPSNSNKSSTQNVEFAEIPNKPNFVVTLENLSKRLSDGSHILKNISLAFLQGAKIGVIGINGSGKSTLMKIIAGLDKEFDGEMRQQPGLKVGYLAQEPFVDPAKSVQEVIDEGIADKRNILRQYEEISARLAEGGDDMDQLLEEQSALLAQIESQNLWDLDRCVEIAKDALRCPPGDARIQVLSGGERRRVALCRLLLSAPDMLLLDEPTNHLDAESVAWLENFLAQYKGTVMLVTHDRYFLDKVTGWILEIENSQGIPYQGNYSAWLKARQERLEAQQRRNDTLEKMIARELEWIKKGTHKVATKAKRKKYEELIEEKNLIEKAKTSGRLIIPPGPRLGDDVIEARSIRKTVDNRALMDDVNFSIPPGAVVGVVGPNGSGKTSLFRILVGLDKPDAGEVVVGNTVKFGYVHQLRDGLNPNNSIFQEVAQGDDVIRVGDSSLTTRQYIAQFNFKGNDQNKAIGMLSGGERNRVHLAKLLRSGCNVLLLDEPTNDLDVDTLRALEDALPEFAGVSIVISHDRWFLDRICTHIIGFENDGKVVFVEGNYQDYAADRKRRMNVSTEKVRFKKLIT
eukprot:TRINITY_DN2568_c0_g1_i1.p1 TRINITY_DN2568_c0_g1~~TRINITY_DN2568_c0_g1_i1.p1  ORF type:complete len:626 (+),score=158.57 TRINITY_DN2568_c0_g1_i1:45-1922(+)